MPPALPYHSDPDILGGTPVFVGTRVPIAALFDHLKAGDPMDVFLEDFPSVSREQAVALLEEAKRRLLIGKFDDLPELDRAWLLESARRAEDLASGALKPVPAAEAFGEARRRVSEGGGT
jgi:uncharacterized protein (DUF433 family)